MQTGWQKNGSDKYYMTKSGGAVTGWQKIGKNTYYFENDGKMVTGEVNTVSYTHLSIWIKKQMQLRMRLKKY